MIWTAAELAQVREALAAGARPSQIGRTLTGQLGRSPDSIAHMARSLRPDGLKRRHWRMSEIKLVDLCLFAGDGPKRVANTCAGRLGRTVDAVRSMAKERLALVPAERRRPAPRPWTLDELRALDAALDAGGLVREIAARVAPQLGRTTEAVRCALLSRRRRRREQRVCIRWTAAEIAHLQAEWARGSSLEKIAMDLGRTVPMVKGMKVKLGLRLDGRGKGGGR